MSTDVHFKTIVDDQFDFHSYCFRAGRCNLQAYLELLRHTDELRTHRFFVAGGLGLIACYVELHRRRENGEIPVAPASENNKTEEAVAAVDTSGMTSKQLKAHKRREKAAAEKAAKLKAKEKTDADEDDEVHLRSNSPTRLQPSSSFVYSVALQR